MQRILFALYSYPSVQDKVLNIIELYKTQSV